MTFGSLFSGIGAFDLGLERAGLECRWQVEFNPFCQRVLARHWPHVGRWDDVRTFLREGTVEPWKVDVLCGGFPCQDISQAGRKEGIDGARSGLWREYARVIGTIRPRYVIVENVRGLVRRGLARVLGDLARLGYDAEWKIISAAEAGAPHLRERLWIVAYPEGSRRGRREILFGGHSEESGQWHRKSAGGTSASGALANADGQRRSERDTSPCTLSQSLAAGSVDSGRSHWVPEPSICRVVDGVTRRLDPDFSRRIRACGNALLPQIAQWIGRRIIESEGE